MSNLDVWQTRNILLREPKRDAVGRAKCSKLYVGTRCKTVDWFCAAAVEAPSSIARCKRQREEKTIPFQKVDDRTKERDIEKIIFYYYLSIFSWQRGNWRTLDINKGQIAV